MEPSETDIVAHELPLWAVDVKWQLSSELAQEQTLTVPASDAANACEAAVNRIRGAVPPGHVIEALEAISAVPVHESA